MAKSSGIKSAERGPIRAFLGNGTEFEGFLSFEGTVRIDGKFTGEIKTDDSLIIGETGFVEAEIDVGHVIIMGNLKGNITASQKVEITSTSKVRGDIVSPVLMIQEGAVLEGNVRMESEPKKVVQLDDVRSESASSQTG